MTDDLTKKRQAKQEQRVDAVVDQLKEPTERLNQLAHELHNEGLSIAQIAGGFIGHGLDILVSGGVPDAEVRMHVEQLMMTLFAARDGVPMDTIIRKLAEQHVEMNNTLASPADLLANAKAALEDAKAMHEASKHEIPRALRADTVDDE